MVTENSKNSPIFAHRIGPMVFLGGCAYRKADGTASLGCVCVDTYGTADLACVFGNASGIADLGVRVSRER